MKRFFAVLLAVIMLAGMIPAASFAATQYAAVVGGWLRLRAGASYEADTITSYYTDTVVEILGTAGAWYHVRTPDGRTGFMHGDFLKLGVSGVSGTENAFVTSTNGYGVRMRKGPGTGYRVINTYAVGTPVTVLERGTYWCRVNIGGTIGYMMSQFLQFDGYANGNGNQSVLCYATIWSSNGYGVRLRSGPSTSYGKIGVYSVGTSVAVLEKGTTWDRIRVGSRTGWMMNDFLIYQNETKSPNLKVGSITLPTLAEGYTSVQPVSMTITNTGKADAVLQQLWLEGANGSCFIVNENGSSVIKAGATDTTWTVQPKAGLAAGHYTATFVVSYQGGKETATVSITVNPKATTPPTQVPTSTPTTAPTTAPVAEPKLMVGSVTLPTLTEGYSSAQTMEMTITNVGGKKAVLQGLWTEGTNGDCFIVNETGSSVIKAGQTNTTWTVQPKAGLSAGTYTATFVVAYEGGTATATVTLTVMEKATTAPTEAPTPTPEPTEAPTPTPEPTEAPTPTPEPTEAPTPTPEPTEAPTPTPEPTEAPTPTPEPTEAPTPTPEPTEEPTPTPKPEKVKLGTPEVTWSEDGTYVTWTAVEGADGYKYYRLKADRTETSKKIINDTSYTFQNPGTAGDVFYVKAVDSTGTYADGSYGSAVFE